MLRRHDKDELAHYSDDCYDVEYEYPWGWDELEGVASRTDYDLKKHAAATGSKLSYFDQNKEDPETGKKGWRYVPYVIEPAAGLTRTTLAMLLDAYHEEEGVDAKGNKKTRVVLKLHPQIAPLKAAVLPLLKKDGHPDKAREIVAMFRKNGINVATTRLSLSVSVMLKHDEIGTPYCITVDGETMENNTVTIRDRDTAEQKRVSIEEAIKSVVNRLNS